MLKKEPVIFAGAARLLVVLGAHFGLHIDADKLLAAYAAVEVVLMPLVRQFVSPVKS